MAARIAQRDELMSSSRIMHALWRWLLADSPLVRRSAFGPGCVETLKKHAGQPHPASRSTEPHFPPALLRAVSGAPGAF